MLPVCKREKKKPKTIESFTFVHVWEKEKLSLNEWGGNVYTQGVSGLPKHARCDAGLIALSNSQPSQWHRRHPETSQPALTGPTVSVFCQCCQAPGSHRARVCKQNQVSWRLTDALVDQNTSPRSFNRLLRSKAEQKSDLSAGPPSTLLQNLGKSHGGTHKTQHTAGWTTKCGYADTTVTYYTLEFKSGARDYIFLQQ